MAKVWTPNTTPASSAESIYNLKQLLKTAGWTVPKSSDGTTFNSSGDQITTGASGAGGMANSRAWFRIQDPGGGREFCFQRGSSGNTTWWIKYSKSAKFTGGAADATNMPTATDEKNLVGTATTGTTAFSGTEGAMRYNSMADNAAPYSWWSYAFSNGGSTTRHFMFMEGMQTGSFDPGDTDPVVLGIYTAGSAMVSTNPIIGWTASDGTVGAVGNNFAWINGTYAGCGGIYYVGSAGGVSKVLIPGGLPVNPYTSKDEVFPSHFARSVSVVAPTGWKGVGANIRYIGTSRALSGDTLTVTTTRDFLVIEGSFAVPWDGSVVTV
jgi:hypothetical protein